MTYQHHGVVGHKCPHCGVESSHPVVFPCDEPWRTPGKEAPIIPLVAGGQGKTAQDTIGTAEGLCWIVGALAWFWLLAWSGCVAS